MDEYEYTTLSTARVWLEAGWYTPEYLQAVIDFRAATDKKLRESMEVLPKEKNT
jgi:hypothetical protein